MFEFYKTLDPSVKKTTVNWRIYSLVQKGVLSRLGRGKYSLEKPYQYIPEVSKELKVVYERIKSDFPYVEICVWRTSILNEFMIHQPGRFYYLVEVEKVAVESVFYYLKDGNYFAFMEPTEELIARYMMEQRDPYIVKSLVTEAPTQKVNGISTVTLEKVLVDIFCDPIIFGAQQGSEISRIFLEAFDRYTLSRSKMLRYASRRRKKAELEKFMLETFKGREKRPTSETSG